MIIRQLFLILPLVILGTASHAGAPQTGPVIKDFGPVFEVPEGAYNLDKNTHYKVTIDVSAKGDFPDDINRKFVSVARFLNMHARNGIDPKNIDFAIIVHGEAGKDLLLDEAYEKRYHEEPNPNTLLLSQLNQAGVKIYLCGQSAAYMKLGAEEMNPAVTMALSAMSAHVRLQHEGYTLIPF